MTRARTLKSKVIFRGPVFGVRRDLVLEPGGVRAVRDVVTHNGSVVLLPVFPDGRILLVRQYRHSVGRYLWELVAGRMEPGEAPLAAARRELEEETGFRARRLTRLFDAYPTPGFVSERLVLYLARGLSPGRRNPDADEQITHRLFRPDALERSIRSGRLRDAKSIAGILFYLRFLRRSP